MTRWQKVRLLGPLVVAGSVVAVVNFTEVVCAFMAH